MRGCLLQRVAVCCSVLQQSVAVKRRGGCNVLQRVVVCCGVLKCAVVCYSVLQWPAVCCSVLQCVEVCRVVGRDSSVPSCCSVS